MKKTFRLYNQINSSFFDLIKGDKETQQTKGLALLLAKSELSLKEFLKIKGIRDKMKGIKLSKINRIIVNAELVSKSEQKLRADIVIRFYSNNQPVKCLIIEAKTANKNISAKSAANQLEYYITNNVFDELKAFNKNDIIGITLTKYSSYLRQDNFISISWSDLINRFYHSVNDEENLLNDYFYFLTNIKGTMKFYEEEVYSIPSKGWSNRAINQFHVYECPNKGRHVIKSTPLFLAFRQSDKKGIMDKLFKVQEIIILNFNEEFEDFKKDESYSKDIRDKVKSYVDYMIEIKKWKELPTDEKQVFVLSEKTIPLPHEPRPKSNNTFRAYYELSELMNPEKVLLEKK